MLFQNFILKPILARVRFRVFSGAVRNVFFCTLMFFLLLQSKTFRTERMLRFSKSANERFANSGGASAEAFFLKLCSPFEFTPRKVEKSRIFRRKFSNFQVCIMTLFSGRTIAPIVWTSDKSSDFGFKLYFICNV